MPSASLITSLEESFMKSCYCLVLSPLFLVITPDAADMYCNVNTTTGGGK